MCHVNCLYMSVTNTKAMLLWSLSTFLLGLCIVIFLFSFLIDIISNTVNITIFANSEKKKKNPKSEF